MLVDRTSTCTRKERLSHHSLFSVPHGVNNPRKPLPRLQPLLPKAPPYETMTVATTDLPGVIDSILARLPLARCALIYAYWGRASRADSTSRNATHAWHEGLRRVWKAPAPARSCPIASFRRSSLWLVYHGVGNHGACFINK